MEGAAVGAALLSALFGRSEDVETKLAVCGHLSKTDSLALKPHHHKGSNMTYQFRKQTTLTTNNLKSNSL